MYSFANRDDCKVIDEPLFGHFLKHTGVWRPSASEVLATMPTDAGVIFGEIRAFLVNWTWVFLKNMANHLEGIDWHRILDFSNVILTRHPAPVISSFDRHIEKPTMLDLGYTHQLRLIQYLKVFGKPFYVLDSDDLRLNPALQLMRLCNFLEIPFSDRMLSWPAGPIPEDGIWAKYWYHNVHRSTGFDPPTAGEYKVSQANQALLEEAEEVYYQILKFRDE